MVLTVTCSPSASLRRTNDSTSSAGAESFWQVVGVEQAAVGVGGPGDLLLAVGDAAEQLELGVGAADEVLEAVGHPGERVLRASR